jgi:IS1 family transposase
LVTKKISAGFGMPLIMKLEKFWHMSFVIGQHQDSVLLKLKALIEPFGVRHFFTDGWGGYERQISQSRAKALAPNYEYQCC